ncbi:hypothetical protein Nmel_004513, partial [Mimus melanotis]
VQSTQFMELAEVENHDNSHTGEDEYIHTQDQILWGVPKLMELEIFSWPGVPCKQKPQTCAINKPNYHKPGTIGIKPIFGWAHISVDQCTMLLDFWTCEIALLEKACQFYFEEHLFSWCFTLVLVLCTQSRKLLGVSTRNSTASTDQKQTIKECSREEVEAGKEKKSGREKWFFILYSLSTLLNLITLCHWLMEVATEKARLARYFPCSLPISIQEIDNHIGKFSVIQKNAFLADIQQASLCYWIQLPYTLSRK